MEVKLLNLFFGLLQAGGAEADAVADVEGGGGVAGEDLDHDFFVSFVVEEDVVTLAPAGEMVHEVVNAELDEVGQGVYAFGLVEALCLKVDFPEAYPGLLGKAQGNAVFLGNQGTIEVLGQGEAASVQFGKAHQLHVGVADGATRERSEVLEEQHVFIAA